MAHPSVEPLQQLLGVWRGDGVGHYPTINAFQYGEELTLAHPNPAKPVVAYSHKTWRATDPTQPMHAECGFLRPKPDGKADFACAQATGLAEASSGAWDAASRTLSLASTSVGNAAKVLEITRRYTLSEDGNELCYSIGMRTHEQPLQQHLHATLKRVVSIPAEKEPSSDEEALS